MRAATRQQDARLLRDYGRRSSSTDHVAQLKAIRRRPGRKSSDRAESSTTREPARSRSRASAAPTTATSTSSGADGTVACSSRPLTDDCAPARATRSRLAPPRPDPIRVLIAPRPMTTVVGGQVAIASAPSPAGRDSWPPSPTSLALGHDTCRDLYGGGRSNDVPRHDRRHTARGHALESSPAGRSGRTSLPAHVNPKPGAEWRDLDGVSRFYAHTPAPKAGWNIYVGEDKSAVLASVSSAPRHAS